MRRLVIEQPESHKNTGINYVLALILVILVAFPSQAQEPNMLQKVQNLKTPLSTNKITVYYSPGHKKKAIELRSMIEDAMRYYEEVLKVKVELSLAVLTQPQFDASRISFGRKESSES